jgi:uncharacterized lipoprotein
MKTASFFLAVIFLAACTKQEQPKPMTSTGHSINAAAKVTGDTLIPPKDPTIPEVHDPYSGPKETY